jgi:hypothetical protein
MTSMRIVLSLFILILLTSCEEPGSYSSIPENDRGELRDLAGSVAHYGASGDTEDTEIDDDRLNRIIEICDENPEAWSFFYASVMDSLSVMEPPEPACQTDIEGYSEDEIEGTHIQ